MFLDFHFQMITGDSVLGGLEKGQDQQGGFCNNPV